MPIMVILSILNLNAQLTQLPPTLHIGPSLRLLGSDESCWFLSS